MNIVILDGFTANNGDLSWAAFEKLGTLTVFDRTDKSEVLNRAENADVLLTNKVVIDKAVFEHCKNLKYVGVLATGYNMVDLEAAKAHGVVVTNIPAYSTESVAQHTFALLLECCSHIGAHAEAVRNGDWTRSIDWTFNVVPLMELHGKTLGIVGAGTIGKRVAEIAQAFGMKTLCCGRNFEVAQPEKNRVSLNELLENSDIVSLHCPLTEETAGLINTTTLSKMKDGAILINTARGGMICEDDVVAALDSGKLAYFAADVAAPEPMSADCPFIGHKKCFITPHIAWAPKEARTRLIDIAFNNLNAFASGSPINQVF